MLNETNRRRLDQIVGQMSDNKESDDDIQTVVDDFKSKYDEPEEKTGVLHPIETAKENIKGLMGDVKDWRSNLSKEGQAVDEEPNYAMKALKLGGGGARLAGQILAEPFVVAARGTALGWPKTTQALGNVGKAAVGAVSQIPITAPYPGMSSTGTTLGDIVPTVSQAWQQAKQEHPVATDVAKQVVSMAPFIPLPGGSIASKIMGAEKPITSTAGDVAEIAGKKGYEKLLGGVPNTELTKYAGSRSMPPAKGLEMIVNDISEKGLDSPLGLKRSAEKAKNRNEKVLKNYDITLDRYIASVPPGVDDRIDVNAIFTSLQYNLRNGGATADQIGIGLPEDIAKADRLLEGISTSLKNRGFNGLVQPRHIHQVKEIINRDTDAFRRGRIPDSEDMLKHNVGKVSYLTIMDALNEKLATAGFPKFKQMGQEINTLNNLERILSNASFSGSKLTKANLMNTLLKHMTTAGAGYGIGGVKGTLIGLAVPTVAKVAPSVSLKLGRIARGISTKPEIVKPLTRAEKAMKRENINLGNDRDWADLINRLNAQRAAAEAEAARAAAEAERAAAEARRRAGYQEYSPEE